MRGSPATNLCRRLIGVPRSVVPVPVMDVGVVRVGVNQRLVSMPMDVGNRIRDGGIVSAVIVLMMLVMHMGVGVIQGLMSVFVFVALGQVQPHT